MSYSHRGQGSLEFLMTYGWVLVTILIALIVMWQWGLFSMGQRIEPGSFGFWGLVVQSGNDFLLTSNGLLKVSLLNTAGANISILSYNVTIDQYTEPWSGPPFPIVKPGAPWNITMSNSKWSDSPGKRFDATIVITYSDNRTADYVFQSSGRIWGNIESP